MACFVANLPLFAPCPPRSSHSSPSPSTSFPPPLLDLAARAVAANVSALAANLRVLPPGLARLVYSVLPRPLELAAIDAFARAGFWQPEYLNLTGDLSKQHPARFLAGFPASFPARFPLERLAAFASSLRRVNLSDSRFLTVLKPLSALPRLSCLGIAACTSLHQSALSMLCYLPSLTCLDLSHNPQVNNATASAVIPWIGSLRHLDLSRTAVTASFLDSLTYGARLKGWRDNAQEASRKSEARKAAKRPCATVPLDGMFCLDLRDSRVKGDVLSRLRSTFHLLSPPNEPRLLCRTNALALNILRTYPGPASEPSHRAGSSGNHALATERQTAMDGRHHQRHGSAGGGAGRQEGNLWGQARSVFMSAILAEPPPEIRREVVTRPTISTSTVSGTDALTTLLAGNDIRIVRRRDTAASAAAAAASAGGNGGAAGASGGEGGRGRGANGGVGRGTGGGGGRGGEDGKERGGERGGVSEEEKEALFAMAARHEWMSYLREEILLLHVSESLSALICSHNTYSRNTCSHNTCSHNTCSHNTCSHNTCSHNTCSHNTCSHNTCSHNTCSHNTCSHNTCSHNTCSHNTCSHNTLLS
ncbi:unnamed protein product [Closterium sp. Yama58-4]|nr:unnamed protein product [Closterium sp. Yama58-4]